MTLLSIFILPNSTYAATELTDLQAYQSVFDAKYYAKNNPDVVAGYGSDANALLQHYISYGIKEGRSASASFNASAYRNRYSDLNNAYGNNWVEYCRHYTKYGKAEKRDARPVTSGNKTTLVTEAPKQFVAEATQTTALAAPSTNGYTCIGSYSTKYNHKIQRAINVELASNRINGIVVQPNGLFSYSYSILPRTVENGYVEAPVFVNKQHAMGIGGGICQVSSTLYAAMLSAGLPAVERHPHSLPVTYIPEGMDATISGTSLDLKFINIYDRPLMIMSKTDKGVLTVSLWLRDKK